MKTIKKILSLYKIPLLVSLTLFIVLTALMVLKDPFDISLAFLGCLLGTVFLDLDYIIYAYFTDMEKDFSRTLRGFIKHKDFENALSHIYYHHGDIKEKTLQSVLFQIVMGGFSLFMVFAPINLFAKSIIISIYVNSIYRLAERFYKEDINDWFWLLKEKPSRKGVSIYLVINIIYLFIILQFL